MTVDAKQESTHRVLVVGVGSIGERHVRCFQRSGRVSVAICESNRRLREGVAERYGISEHLSDLEAALAEPLDAAVVAVPADLHVPIGRQILDAGLHLLLEKPVSVSADGVDALMESATKSGRIAAVGYVYRAHPALAAMKCAIDSGEFGRPLQVVVNAGQNFPTYRPAYRDSYYVDRRRGGGAIQDAMTHLVNAVEWLVGPASRVVADAANLAIRGVDVEDTVHFLARHGSVLGCYSLNQFQSPNEVTITVACEAGTARFEYHRNRWRWMKDPDEPWQIEPVQELERDTLFLRQANAFLDAITCHCPPLCSLREGIQTLRVNLALLRSVERGGWEAVE